MVPKMALIRENGGRNIRFHVRDLEKAYPCAEPRVLAYFESKSIQGPWLYYSELQEPKKQKTNTFLVRKLAHGCHGWNQNSLADRDELLYRCPRHDHVCRFLWLSLTRFGRGEWVNFGLLHWLASSPLQLSHYHASVWFQGHAVITHQNVTVFVLSIFGDREHSGRERI